MTSLLDSRSKMQKLDKRNVLGSIEALPAQIQDAWDQTQLLSFPTEYKQVENIIVSGMGGSSLGAYVAKHLFKQELKVPLEVYSSYQLPGYVNAKSLVILSSYSGTTEEVLATAEKVKALKAKVIVIATGGKLLELAKDNNWPFYQIKANFNPSNQPRMSSGYAIIGQLSILAKLGFIKISSTEIKQLVTDLGKLSKKLNPEALRGNMAKLLAIQAYDKLLILSGAEHLIGAVHVTNNQLNENAKLLTAEWHLPEFDHHYMEALTNPKKLKEDILFLLYNSHLYDHRVNRRVYLTAEVIKRAGYEAEIIEATADTKLSQIFEIIILGAYMNFYLSMLYGIDPAPIPNVDYFKSAMAK